MYETDYPEVFTIQGKKLFYITEYIEIIKVV